MDEEYEEYVDEGTIMSLKLGLILYGLIGLVLIIAPLVLTIFSDWTLSIWHIIIYIILAGKYCYEQVVGRIQILSSLEYIKDDDNDTKSV